MGQRQAMENKSQGMKNLINNMSASLYGISVTEAIEKGICINCQQLAMSYCYSDAGVKEYYISGLCEKCFDEITGGGDE